jgi:anti-sigma-K factor RskA
MKNDSTQNLSGAYALDAVDAADRATYEAALHTASEETRSEAIELNDTAVLLGLAAAPVEPSAALKHNLLAQIAVTPQLPTNEVDAAPTPAEKKAALRWSRPATAIVSLAAAVALIVGGIAVGTTSLHPEPSYQAAQMAAITEASDVQQLDTTLASGEQITLRWSPELASSVIIVDGMAAAPSDKVYQLWYIGQSGARAAGFLPVTNDVESWQVLEGDMHAGDSVGVTVEPAGGSKTPTSDPIMVIEPA